MVRACCSSVRPAWVGCTPCRPRTSKRGAERVLHVADAGRGGREREVGALGAVGDAAGIDDVAEQAQIGEIEAHGTRPLPSHSDLTKVDYAKSSL